MTGEDGREAARTQLFESIKNEETDRVKLLSSTLQSDGGLEFVDEFGTSPLQSAAYKGNAKLVATLLQAGADVNYRTDHPHRYTALMFAALSGSEETTRLLLEAGADIHAKNSIGRSAGELASFTGQHHCVSLINNFLPLTDILKAAGVKDGKYSEALIKAIYEITSGYNIHPVKIILFLQDWTLLLEEKDQTLKVLEDIMDDQMRRKETNEVMALKIHLVLRMLKEINVWCKKEGEEKEIMREICKLQMVKEFPFQQSTLFQTMVKTLASTPVGGNPDAVTVIRQALLGHKMLMSEHFCATCGTSPSSKRCSVCKAVYYCSAKCQKLAWFAHKKLCAKPS